MLAGRADDEVADHRHTALTDIQRQIFRLVPTGAIGMLCAVALVIAETLSADAVWRRWQLVWGAAVCVAVLDELWVVQRWHRTPGARTADRWLVLLCRSNGIIALLWGLYAFLVPHLGQPDRSELLHLVLLCACTAGALTAFAGFKPLVFTFLVPMWGLEVLALTVRGSYGLAAGSVVFAIVMVRYLFEASSSLNEAMVLRHSAAALTEQLRLSEMQARSVIDTAMEAILSTDLEGRVFDVNPAGSALIGLEHDRVESRFVGDFLPVTGSWLRAGEAPNATFEDTLISGRGQVRSVIVSISLVDPSGAGLITVMARDISERKRLEDQLAHEASHDGLTGLPNRIGFFRRAEAAVDACRTIDEEVAVLFVDLDRFKQVNDSLGHAAGDELLLQASRRLQGEIREDDLVARLGGDEFVLLLPRPPSAEELMVFGRRLITTLERPFRLGDDEARISASVGIASVRARTAQASALVARADMAMYKAKQAGRRQVVLYDRDLQDSVDEHIRLEQAFRRALERRELEPWLQPIVSLADGSLVGAEVLTRWRDPNHGIITPDVFIPLAHEAGLIADLGRWVLDRAADLLEDWAEEDALRHCYLSVNIAGGHLLQGTVAAEIDRKLIQRGVDPSKLLVELTETDLAHDLDVAHDALHAIRRLGAEVAIDDFGTGYSSLAYLQGLPASALKIDRSFVGRVTQDRRQRTLVGAVCELGRAFAMRVIAEGIEEPEQAAALVELGCRYGQGYLYGRPMPAEQFLRAWAVPAGQVEQPEPGRAQAAAESASISSSSEATVNATMLA
ncbi:MAG: EAL domain-containing protein [Acidimicrobiales bacterium]|nr:EAL domain-containing protein [Acidimicrobiales bacterium]